MTQQVNHHLNNTNVINIHTYTGSLLTTSLKMYILIIHCKSNYSPLLPEMLNNLKTKKLLLQQISKKLPSKDYQNNV